jgi:hypothetical protein
MKRALLSATAAAGALAVAIPLSAPAHHQPGHEGGGQPGELTIAAAPNPVLWANTTTISGRLKGAENSGRTIELQQNPHPYPGPFRILAKTTTNARGEYTFAIAPARHTIYRTVARTSPVRTSAELRVRVRVRINRRVTDRTPARGRQVTFYGAVAPAHDGAIIRIQRRGGDGAYRTVARTRLTDAGERFPTNSFYERKLRIRRDGTFRALIGRDEDHAGNKSRRVRLDVR